MKIAYFDCFAGAGGDMIVAAMLDAGLDAEFLKSQLATLDVDGLEVQIEKTSRLGLKAMCFKPKAPHQHSHRHLKQITEIINKSQISEAAKKTAITTFNRLAEAEAAVHGTTVEKVHFHEVGAVDSIADIVSAAIGIEFLKQQGISKIYCSALSVGGGTVQCEHGLMPVPAPATAELLKGVPIKAGPFERELLTPTAAAVFTTIADGFCHIPSIKIEKVGCGAGTFESEEFPNVLRLILGESSDEKLEDSDCVCLLETNIDDISGEVVGFAVDALLKAGALDVFTTPIYMKNNRPGVKISVICEISELGKFEQIIFAQGISFGIRREFVQRSKLAREFVEVETKYGPINVKIGRFGGKIVAVKAEFADCVKAANKYNVAVREVLKAAIAGFKGLK